MATPPLPDNVLQETVDLVGQWGNVDRAAREAKIPRSTLINRLQRAAERGITSTLIPSDIPDGMNIKGTSTLYDANGNIRLQWIKTKEDKERYLEKIRGMVDEFKEDLPRIKRKPLDNKKFNSKLMNVIPMGDPHFGMYSWADETGNDFDLDIARKDLCGAVAYLVGQSPDAERCIIANLGDFFHIDNYDGATSKGTRLDFDSRLPKVMQVGVAAIRQAIETALEKHKTVEIINSIGNHDEVLSSALSILLAHVYEKEPRVVVHDQPTRRHYIRHGQVLIGITHGDKVKDSLLPGVMAIEKAEDWGATRFRYFLRGHQHHSTKLEFNGCIVEQFRTLAPGDAYTVTGGWLAGRDMNNITFHADYGEVSRTTCSINLLRDLAK